MTNVTVHSVASRWAKLGVMLNVIPAGQTPDIERLLLDTARVASSNSRLLFLAAEWLSSYGNHVDARRLTALLQDELEIENRPTLGLLLELANQQSHQNDAFDRAIDACGVAIDSRPLSDVECKNPLFRRLAEQRASALSRKWGRWTIDLSPKKNALRPLQWVLEQNPSLLVPAHSADANRHQR